MKLTDLTVARTIFATPEQVFDLWIDSSRPGGPFYGAERLILNPVVDGLFYEAVKFEGKTWPHYGRFVKLERPGLIEHTWVSEGTRGLETMISITLEAKGGETEVTLRHIGLPDDEEGRKHADGWTWILSMLAEQLSKRSDGKGS